MHPCEVLLTMNLSEYHIYPSKELVPEIAWKLKLLLFYQGIFLEAYFFRPHAFLAMLVLRAIVYELMWDNGKTGGAANLFLLVGAVFFGMIPYFGDLNTVEYIISLIATTCYTFCWATSRTHLYRFSRFERPDCETYAFWSLRFAELVPIGFLVYWIYRGLMELVPLLR